MGSTFLYHAETTSTQDIAEQAAKRGEGEGTVVISERQTCGRGRKKRTWISPAHGGIYLSTILRPKLRPDRALQIPLIAGVAAVRAIKAQTRLMPVLKWPNDILLSGKKVGGILTEMSSDIDEVHYTILGIGINVNASRSDMPGTLQKTAISLTDACGHSIPRVALVQRFLIELENCYREFISSGFKMIRKEWLSLSQTIGSRVRVITGYDIIEGKAIDIDGDGFLLVREESGRTTRIVSGDVFPADSIMESGS
jgi:BirA family biotin operon repressor/biotin-[acetyl-CoA-carboxylase] ligase